MKYKVGDRVKIKSLDWYNENKDEYGVVLIENGDYMFCKSDTEWCDKIVTIEEICLDEYYTIVEDSGKYRWTDEMIEGLVEEETLIERIDDNGLPFNEWLSHKGAFHVPDGYKLKDENGNVINTTKIVLEKKKKEYPKTYEECCEVLKVSSYKPHLTYNNNGTITEYLFKRLCCINKLTELIICRDAYWKIAGDELRLGKPWEPDFTNDNDDDIKYCIGTDRNNIVKYQTNVVNCVLAFPTEEMRDAFYESFKEEIEKCKKLL